MKIREVGKVFETNHYNLFSFRDKNREVNESNVAKLKKGILEDGQLVDIIVNGNYEIVDGQNRFVALQDLNLPIRFVVRDYGRKTNKVIIKMQEGLRWQLYNFLSRYEDKEDYAFLRKIMNDNDLQITAAYTLITGSDLNGTHKQFFKEGDTHFTAEEKRIAQERIGQINKLCAVRDGKWASTLKAAKMLKAVVTLISAPGFRLNRMLDVLEVAQKGDLTTVNSVSDGLAMLEDLYNFGLKKEFKIFLVDAKQQQIA